MEESQEGRRSVKEEAERTAKRRDGMSKELKF
jgi:hypothetical protein